MISLVCNANVGKLWQFSLERKIKVYTKNTVTEIWFYKGGLKKAVPFVKDGESVVAEVPNIMLKDFGVMTVEVISLTDEGVTHKERQNFYVHKREKPSWYAYTETETIGVLNESNSDGGGASYDLILEYSGTKLSSCSTGSLQIVSGEQTVVREKALKEECAKVLLQHRTTYLTTPTFYEDIPLAVSGPSNLGFRAYGLSVKEMGVVNIYCAEDGSFTMEFTSLV